MDLTIKSKSWAGNICHQFESICQDVDGLMSKDTVRFVENQVQSVGISVKRFYSNVVQDILQHSEDVAKRESKSADSEQVDAQNHLKSVAGITTEPITVNEKQFFENQGLVDTNRNSDASLPIEVDSGITKVSIPVAVNIISDGKTFTATSDEDHKNSTTIIREERWMTAERGRRAFNHQEENEGFSDDTVESTLHMAEDQNSDDNGSLFDLTVASAHKTNEDSILALTSGNLIQKAESVTPAECNGSAYNISNPDFTAAYETKGVDALPDFTAAYETKGVDVLPDFLIFESNDNACLIDASDFGQSEIEMSRPSETGNKDEFIVGVGDLNMETVDLSPDVKYDEASVFLSDNFAHAATHRRRNFRYYKKLIKDALTSRKRLSKEYEHLAILYGDIDSESSQHFEPRSVHSSPNTSVHAVRTQSFHEMSETEWELV